VFGHVHALAGHGAFGVFEVDGHFAEEGVAVDEGLAEGAAVDLSGFWPSARSS
jgi:hypothetical protein